MYPYNNPESTNQYGFGYGVARPQARNTQPLTQEQIQKLRTNSEAFDMKVTQEELWAAACTHKEKTGQSALRANEDGTFTCSICHKTFKLCDLSPADVEAAVSNIIDALQTCKTVYLDAPDELIVQYFQMIPLLEKLPKLWNHAMRNFAQYDGYNPAMNQYPIGYSGFAAINQLMTNPYMGGVPAGYGQVPAGYGVAPQAPVYGAQQPMMNYGAQPVAYGANPMAYGQPMNVPAPAAAPAPGVMPGMAPAVPVAPAAAPAPQQAEVQQQQVFNV